MSTNIIDLQQDRNYKHNHKERLCYCCDTLQGSENDITKLYLGSRGYGSIYDGTNSYIQLCPKCLKKEYIKWFNEEPTMVDGYCEDYKYEENIEKLIGAFPLENQEYFRNSNCDNWCFHDKNMKRQDWIDMMNGVMSDEKYKQYHMYSPSEIKAYEEKFPTCEHPLNVLYDDSKGCKCIYGAYGDYGQKADKYNTWEECYNCKHYKLRKTPIKDITHDEYEQLEKEIFGETTEEKFDRMLKHLNDKNN